MVATAVTASLFPVTSPSPDSGAKATKLGCVPGNLGGLKSKNGSSSGGLHVKTNAQAPSKVNGTTVAAPAENVKLEDDFPSSRSPRTFINQLPDWSMLLAAITTIFLAAEKQWMMLDWKPRRTDMLTDPFGMGKIVQDGLMFRQNFSIRSYEIGADRTASIETLMNHLQETALNHVKSAGILGDGFGSTPEMCKKNLIWVVTRMQVVVDRYPTWGDVVQVDTWVSASGKNGMRRDWLIRDSKTGEILTRASSVWVMMNKLTRRLSKMPEEVRGEIGSYFVNSPSIVEEDNKKLPKLDDTADYIRTGLSPRWSDLDVNQHVNNVKYIGWILEGMSDCSLALLQGRLSDNTGSLAHPLSSQKNPALSAFGSVIVCQINSHCVLLRGIWSAPQPILESHELCAMTLEYRRECGKNSVLQSLTDVSGADVGNLADGGSVECKHLLRLEDGAEIVRGRTEWRLKPANNFGVLNQVPAEST